MAPEASSLAPTAAQGPSKSATPAQPHKESSPAQAADGDAAYDFNQPIEADDEPESDYSASIDDRASSTQSVTSSILNYVYENGRRYHSRSQDAAYPLPNDEVEQDRLDLAHHVMLLLMKGEYHLAPLKNPQRVLDCGTGTGIWALEFGDQNPQAVVTGVDISAIQPGWTAPNVKFEIDDLERPWTWPANHFDFIHSRAVLNGLRNWPGYIRQMYTHTAPGGWVELSEWSGQLYSDDGSTENDTALAKWWRLLPEGARKAGLSFPTGDEMKAELENAGFTDVTLVTFNVPWGTWPKNQRLKYLGATVHALCETGLEAYGLHLLTAFCGLSEAEAKKLFQDALKDIGSRKVHGYQKIFQIYGRKPE